MTTPRAEGEVLKQDTRGRVRVSEERREALLAEFERSGLSGAKFARLAGVKYATFANWVAQRRKQRVAGEGSGAQERPIRLLEAVMESGTSRISTVEGLAVELPGGSRVVVGSPMQLPMAAELVVLVAQGMRRRC